MNKNFLTSIAMATYNGENYLKEQLDSIYAQTYTNIEVIVTDDCSTDGTLKILKQYAKTHGLKYYVNEENLGFVKNFERAISLCEGEYIALADQDDIWETNKLEILVNEIGENLLIHSDCKLIDAGAKIIQESWKNDDGYNVSADTLMFKNVVTGCTILFKRELLQSAMPFPDTIAYHDWWLSICASLKNAVTYSNKTLVRYRQHIGQDTGAGNPTKIFILSRVVQQVIDRKRGMKFHKLFAFKKHLKNLLALKEVMDDRNQYSQVLDDAIVYFQDYIENQVHLKTFKIGLKYHKILYPHKNYLYLKNILLDIVG